MARQSERRQREARHVRKDATKKHNIKVKADFRGKKKKFNVNTNPHSQTSVNKAANNDDEIKDIPTITKITLLGRCHPSKKKKK